MKEARAAAAFPIPPGTLESRFPRVQHAHTQKKKGILFLCSVCLFFHSFYIKQHWHNSAYIGERRRHIAAEIPSHFVKLSPGYISRRGCPARYRVRRNGARLRRGHSPSPRVVESLSPPFNFILLYCMYKSQRHRYSTSSTSFFFLYYVCVFFLASSRLLYSPLLYFNKNSFTRTRYMYGCIFLRSYYNAPLWSIHLFIGFISCFFLLYIK